jgi:hypothetical protein
MPSWQLRYCMTKCSNNRINDDFRLNHLNNIQDHLHKRFEIISWNLLGGLMMVSNWTHNVHFSLSHHNVSARMSMPISALSLHMMVYIRSLTYNLCELHRLWYVINPRLWYVANSDFNFLLLTWWSILIIMHDVCIHIQWTFMVGALVVPTLFTNTCSWLSGIDVGVCKLLCPRCLLISAEGWHVLYTNNVSWFTSSEQWLGLT